MDLVELSDRVTRSLNNAIAGDLSDAEREAVLKIVRQALVDATGQAHESNKKTAVVCCGPEADLAHKIQDQMDKQRDILIANLMAMR